MPRYEILSTGAGRNFRQGDVVSEEQIRANGSTPDHWLKAGGIKEVSDDTPLNVAAEAESRAPEITTGNNTPGSDPLGAKAKLAGDAGDGKKHAAKSDDAKK